MGPGRRQGRGRAAAAAAESEEEAAAEQPLGRLEPAEESSGSSDESDDVGSVAGAGGRGEGARRERLRERRRPQLGARLPALVRWERAAEWLGALSYYSSRIPPSPARLSSSGSAAGFALELGERALEQTRVGASCPQSPSLCVESQNHKTGCIGRDFKYYPVPPPAVAGTRLALGRVAAEGVTRLRDDALGQARCAGAPEALTGQESGRSRRCMAVGTGWAEGRRGGFSSTAANTVLFPHLRTIQVRMKTLQKIQYNSLEGNCEGVDIGVSCRARHRMSQV